MVLVNEIKVTSDSIEPGCYAEDYINGCEMEAQEVNGISTAKCRASYNSKCRLINLKSETTYSVTARSFRYGKARNIIYSDPTSPIYVNTGYLIDRS